MNTDALRVLDGGRAPQGWEALWQQDVWLHTELPHGDLASTYRGVVRIKFERLAQPWLKEAAKRWVRARMLGDTTPRTMSAYLSDLWPFSEWLATFAPEVLAPQLLTRAILEDYLLWVRRESDWKPATRSRRVTALRALLNEQREDALAGIATSAQIHSAEIPSVDYRLPKELGSDVFEQIVDPNNLAVLQEQQHRTVILLLAHTGFRVSSIVTLPRETLQRGPDGHPYLRYWNIKAKREAMLPVPPRLADQVTRQLRYLEAAYSDGTQWLLPSPPVGDRQGKGGDFHVCHTTVRRILKHYIREADIRTGDGQLALHVHPHLFRHHMGTSMVNDNVPLTVIQKVLDHGSIEMTARYAHLHDETLKREVLRWHERVNRRGERIALPVQGPLEDAAWMKERISRAKQALPNGYCGLPLVQTCPHPNACLSCDNFLTDGSFRQVHQHQQTETERLLVTARENNNTRLVEVLERDHHSLTSILDGLDQIDDNHDNNEGAQLDLLDLATAATSHAA